MRRRTAAWVAWSLCALALAAGAGSVVFIVLTGPAPVSDQWGFRGLSALLGLVFSVAGALVASGRPQNPLGWILIGVGVAGGVQGLGEEYGNYVLTAGAGGPAGADIGLWLGEWVWVLPVGSITTFLLLLFPEGRLLSSRWRAVAWVAPIGIAVPMVALALAPGPLESTPRVDNPFGVGSPEASGAFEAVGLAGLLVLLAAGGASAGSLILRFRRASGAERQQLKWLAYVGVFVVIGFGATAVGQVIGTTLGDIVLILAMFSVPVAVGIAVLRYRLYDIDLVINRTLVYGALTALLGGVYLAAVVGLGSLARSMTGQTNNALVVAASTLAVAALFGPARRRIQGFIDRRFYRRKYDAARTLAAFGARLRDEVDLDELTTDLISVVRRTVQPTYASLWLREPAP